MYNHPFFNTTFILNNTFLAVTARQQFPNTGNGAYYQFSSGGIYNLSASHTWPDYAAYGPTPFTVAIDYTATVGVGAGVLASQGVYSVSIILNDNNTEYYTYVEGWNLVGAYGSNWASTTIVASNLNKPAPISVQYPNYNNFIVDGDNLVIYFQIINNFNFPINCIAFGDTQNYYSNLIFDNPTQSSVCL
jgi:hypothetical protein